MARAASPVSIGAIYLDSQGYYAGVRKGVQNGAASMHRSIRLVETTAQDDPSKESTFIDTLISANVKPILLSAVSADGSVHAIRRAHEAGIPVVCYNNSWGRCGYIGETGEVIFKVSDNLMHQQRRIIGSWVTSLHNMDQCAEDLADWPRYPRQIITDRFSLAEAPAAYAPAASGRAGKVIIRLED